MWHCWSSHLQGGIATKFQQQGTPLTIKALSPALERAGNALDERRCLGKRTHCDIGALAECRQQHTPTSEPSAAGQQLVSATGVTGHHTGVERNSTQKKLTYHLLSCGEDAVIASRTQIFASWSSGSLSWLEAGLVKQQLCEQAQGIRNEGMKNTYHAVAERWRAESAILATRSQKWSNSRQKSTTQRAFSHQDRRL